MYSFFETLLSSPRIIEFKEIRKVLENEAERLGVAVTQNFPIQKRVKNAI